MKKRNKWLRIEKLIQQLKKMVLILKGTYTQFTKKDWTSSADELVERGKAGRGDWLLSLFLPAILISKINTKIVEVSPKFKWRMIKNKIRDKTTEINTRR